MEFEIFGRRIIVERDGAEWVAFDPGDDGKRRRARDIFIPRHITESELAQYLADLCHESASPSRPDVKRLR